MDADQLRAAMAEAMHKADCACGATMDGDHHTPDVPEWYGSMAGAAWSVVASHDQEARAEERAKIVAWLRAFALRQWWHYPAYRDRLDTLADMLDRGEFDDVAAGDE